MLVKNSVRAAAMAVGLSAMIGLAAPSAYADLVIGEGSVTDTTNIVGASLSDASASGVYVAPSGCTSSATTPASRPAAGSPTLEQIYSEPVARCTGGGSLYDTWKLQRHRWYGWQTLSQQSGGGTGTFVFTGDLYTNCSAGTWSYRVEASNYHTPSFRHTCVNRNTPTYVDLS